MKQGPSAVPSLQLLDLPDEVLWYILQLVDPGPRGRVARAAGVPPLERGVPWGELRTAADEPAALELAESFEAALALEGKVLGGDPLRVPQALREALRVQMPGLELERLTGLHLPGALQIYDKAAAETAARCPCGRLRRLSFSLSKLCYGLPGGVLGQLSGLPLAELAAACPRDSPKYAWSLRALAGTSAGLSIRSLQLGDRLCLGRDAAAAFFSFPRLQRLFPTALVVLSEAEGTFLEGLARRTALREIKLLLDARRYPRAGFPSRLGEALRGSALSALDLQVDSRSARDRSFLPSLLEGAGALASARLSHPLELAIGEDPPEGYDALSALGARLQVCIPGYSPQQAGALRALRRLVLFARVYVDVEEDADPDLDLEPI
eukprot:tig00000269_g23736.t1